MPVFSYGVDGPVSAFHGRSLLFFGCPAGDLIPPPGYGLLSPARQIGSVLLPAPLPRVVAKSAALITPCRGFLASLPCSSSPNRTRCAGLRFGGLRWTDARRDGGNLGPATKEALPEGPNGSLPPARGPRWSLVEGESPESEALPARISMARPSRLHNQTHPFHFPGPITGPLRGLAFPWGPRYGPSCVGVPHRTPPGHGPGAFTNR